ncbi:MULTISPECIES: TVP38/TMEM64 family protein [Methylomicrobium]|uniref:TVP38/TMEM64 family membrane protein n=1 Tax=Methylomicrobium album BG8 TaxID=686340 RepID=H8GL82_METAL|nr:MULTISPECIES: VTT domain-containing protein [Methylomicrobium]EIC28081.1 hypothetical protein Metal_0217 [Methylomicrobium album BG8]
MMPLPRSRLTWKLAALPVFVALVLLLGHELELYLPDVEVWIQGFGVFAPLGFILLFTVLTPVFVSVDALCLAAGVLFPLATAETVVIIATYLSASAIFFLGRDFLRARVETFLAGHQRFAALDKAISGKRAFRVMFLLRLTPLPFAMLGYALSVTGVKFRPYLGATTGILVYNASLVYFGYAAKHLTGLVQNRPAAGFVSYGLLVLGLGVSVAVLIFIAKMAANLLKELSLENSAH